MSRPTPVSSNSEDYGASSIRVLEGLEPVRMRPGMYIGGTDEKALHHLFAEVIDNSMDEAVAGHANFIDVHLDLQGYITVTDNGRGIPVENHPQVPGKSTLEVIMTTLHAGGKFDGKAYETSGGLHGVGVSVVNALSDVLEVEVARGRKLYRQRFSRGIPQGGLEELGDVHNRRGTRVRFHPDPQIFGEGPSSTPAACSAWRARRPICSAASKSAGAAILRDLQQGLRRSRQGGVPLPRRPEGLPQATMGKEFTVTREIFAGKTRRPAAMARSNGRSPGMAATFICIPIATPFRRLKAAPTRPASASR
jgi:topoisomerase-4 subunit B